MRGRACESEKAWKVEGKVIIKGEERSTDWDEWNRLQPMGVVGREGQVELNHSPRFSASLCL